MKSFLLSLIVLSSFNFAFAQHEHAVTNAKIGHDASHRIGRLVDTGKLDEVFIKNMNSLEVTPLGHTEHTDPAFSVTATAAAGKSQTVLTFDMAGKFLTNKIVSQTSTEDVPWDVDSSEVIEAALHYLMETTNADLMTFNMDLVKATLNQNKNDDGTLQAVVSITSSKTTKTLRILLSTKGEVISSSVVE